MTKKQAPAKTPRKLIHEMNNQTRLHRLIIIQEGRPDTSEWCEFHIIGMFRGIHFSAGTVAGFPSGPFFVRPQPYEVLA